MKRVEDKYNNVEEEYTLGKLIEETRKRRKITREALAKGIMSEGNLRKLETGELTVDKFTWDILLNRLGISSLIYECYVTESEFEFYKLQVKIRELVNKCIRILYLGEADKSKNKITKFVEDGRIYCQKYKKILMEQKGMEGVYNVIHILFLETMEAYFLKIEGADIEVRFKQIHNTWNQVRTETLEQLKDKKKRVYLSCTELEVLLLMAEVYEDSNQRRTAKEILSWICDYCCIQYEEEKLEKVKIYPYAVYKLASMEGKDNNWKACESMCVETLELLIDTGSLRCMIPLMDLLLDHWDNGELLLLYNKEQLTQQRDCLLHIFKEFKQNPYGVYPLTIIENAVLVTEVIKRRRDMLNITQQTLSSGIIEPENFSRFEKGKLNVRWRKIALLLERLGIPSQKERLLIESTDTRVVSEYQKIATSIYKDEVEIAKRKFQFINQRIDKKRKRNRQYLLITRILIQKENYQINSLEEEKKLCEKALQVTIPDYPNVDLTELFLTRVEGSIINNFALAYKRMGEIEKSIELYESAIKSYENQKINKYYPNRSQVLLKENYVTLFGDMNKFEEAVQYSKDEIVRMLKAGTMEGMARMLYEIAWNLYECNHAIDTKKACKQYFLQALTIAKLKQNRSYIRFLLERKEKYVNITYLKD